MIFLIAPLIALLWAIGGQINKLFRPIGIPLILIGAFFLFSHHPLECILPSLLYGGILTLGYGEHSKLMGWLHDDELVRDIFGLLCSLPVILTAVLTENFLSILGIVLVAGAFQIRLGSWGKIGKYDILPEDLLRGLSVGVSMAWALK